MTGRGDAPGPAARPGSDAPPRPAQVCRALLAALDATEGRRRRRKRDTSADAIGIAMKRTLLEQAVGADPDPSGFEGWLLERCFEQGPGEGAWRAMALELFQEWRMAAAAPSFRAWLEAGAPSDDRPGDDSAPDRRRLPILAAALALGLAGCGGGIEADVEDVPSIEVEESERPRGAAAAARVLEPLRAREPAGELVYDPPADLARPPSAVTWPPPTGTEGDAARGADRAADAGDSARVRAGTAAAGAGDGGRRRPR